MLVRSGFKNKEDTLINKPGYKQLPTYAHSGISFVKKPKPNNAIAFINLFFFVKMISFVEITKVSLGRKRNYS